MKLPWLETLVKEGHVRPAVRAQIHADVGEILKLAKTKEQAVAEAHQKVEQFFDRKVKPFVDKHWGSMLGLGLYAANTFKNSRLAKKELDRTLQDITSIRAHIVNHPDFQEDPQKAEVRYLELVKVAPSIATNPHLAIPLVKRNLNSGFSSSDIQTLAIAQSNYTPNVGVQKNLTNTALASQRPFPKTASEDNSKMEKVGSTLATIAFMYKEAGISFETLGRAAQNALVLSAIPVLGGVGAGLVKHVSSVNDKRKLERRLAESFEKAIKISDPEKDGLVHQKEKARQAFQILAHFSPHVALEPHAAKAFMSKLVDFDSRVQIEDIKNLSDIQKNFLSTKSPTPFFEGLASGAKAMGLEHSLKSSVSGIAGPMSEEIEGMTRYDLKH